jgi:hypothetical protein
MHRASGRGLREPLPPAAQRDTAHAGRRQLATEQRFARLRMLPRAVARAPRLG